MSDITSRADTARAEALAREGRVGDAYEALSRAAAGGNGPAAFAMAQWRLTGEFIRRDLGLARELFGRAAMLGQVEAGPIFTALLANGAGGTERRWPEAIERLQRDAARSPAARRQLAVLDAMDLDARGDPARDRRGEMLSKSPSIARFAGFLTADECAYIASRAEPLLTPSVVVHPVTGAFVQDPIRSSTAAEFPFVVEDPVLHAINRRIAAATFTTYEQGEPLQVLSYGPAQEYKLHYDALPNVDNQRELTFLTYLNDGFEGGETHFPHIDLAFRGRPGDAILFVNVDGAGRPDMASRHAGLPVRSGRKLLLSKWIRASPLDLSGPPGRPF